MRFDRLLCRPLFALLALFGVFVTGIAQDAHSANYFNWNAESDTTSAGAIYGYGDGTSRYCSEARSGNCSMRLIVRGNDNLNQGMGADNPGFSYGWPIVGSPAIYYRWWMKIMPGFKWGSGAAKTKSSRVHGGSAQGYTGYLMSYGFLIGECADAAGCTLNNGGDNGSDSSLVINYNFRTKDDGVWHEYIVKVKPNTSASCVAPTNCNAEFEAWVDGVSVGRYDNYKLNKNPTHMMEEAWGAWMMRPYFQLGGTASDGGTIYLDDFSVDDVFNTQVIRGSISPPTNLQVQ